MSREYFDKIDRAGFESSLKRLKDLPKKFNRVNSPVRGFVNKWFGKDDFLYKKYQQLVEAMLTDIRNSNLSPASKEAYLTWETFQSQQKGPVSPYDSKALDKIIEEFQPSSFEISEENWRLVESVFASLVRYLQGFVSIDVLALKPADAWSTLPSTTVRGYPFVMKGAVVDDRIKALGGNTPESAIEFVESDPDLICSPGFRIQGSPGSGSAKTRIVFIPSVSSQYLDVALVKESMRQLSSCPIFSGWLSKADRDASIARQNITAERRGFKRIQLDWSKFDKHVHPKLQNLVQSYYDSVCINGRDILERRKIMFAKHLDSQRIPMVNSAGNLSFYSLRYQLISGRLGTQHDGSFIGLIQQGVIFKKIFGGDIPWDLCNQLGDDALFPVPIQALSDLGYENLLSKVSQATGEFGFALNPKKAYPNSDAAFLQKLYIPEHGIVGAGTFARSLASFLWKEKFAKPIKGVKRLWALELISQISILSEPFSKSHNNVHFVAENVVEWWLDHDDYLVSVMRHLGDKLNENSLFRSLILLTNRTKDEIIEDLGLKSYDHTGFSEALDSEDFSSVFPILSVLVRLYKPGRNVPSLDELSDIETIHRVDEYITGNTG